MDERSQSLHRPIVLVAQSGPDYNVAQAQQFHERCLAAKIQHHEDRMCDGFHTWGAMRCGHDGNVAWPRKLCASVPEVNPAVEPRRWMAIEPKKEPKVFYIRNLKQRMTRNEHAPPPSRSSSSSSSSSSTRSSALCMQVILGALTHALQPVLLQDGCIHATQVKRKRAAQIEQTARIAAASAAEAVVACLQFLEEYNGQHDTTKI